MVIKGPLKVHPFKTDPNVMIIIIIVFKITYPMKAAAFTAVYPPALGGD
jgi:hypothetical protein